MNNETEMNCEEGLNCKVSVDFEKEYWSTYQHNIELQDQLRQKDILIKLLLDAYVNFENDILSKQESLRCNSRYVAELNRQIDELKSKEGKK